MKKYLVVAVSFCVLTIGVCISSVRAGNLPVSEEHPGQAVNESKVAARYVLNTDIELQQTEVPSETPSVKEPVQPAEEEHAGEKAKESIAPVQGAVEKGVGLEKPEVSVEAPSAKEQAQPAEEHIGEKASEGKIPAEGTVNKEITLEQPEVPSETPSVKDPIEPFNRAMFTFNDKVYHYFFKPIYTGYNSTIPERARVSVRDFYTNIQMPIRFFNCLFQAQFNGAGTEMVRFVINSTMGVGGFWDPAKSKFHIEKQDRDFGQTLGKHKMKPGIYIVWPFVGPSNVRDTAGYAGDAVLNPLTWISVFFLAPIESLGNYTYYNVNEFSVDKGSAYENITKPAIDPYIALQDAYIQNRAKKMKQ